MDPDLRRDDADLRRDDADLRRDDADLRRDDADLRRDDNWIPTFSGLTPISSGMTLLYSASNPNFNANAMYSARCVSPSLSPILCLYVSTVFGLTKSFSPISGAE